MARGYIEEEVKSRLISLLTNSKTGLSGVEVSAELGINRVTMTKFLNVFAAEGIIKQKNIGNLNLWLIEEGTENLKFPILFCLIIPSAAKTLRNLVIVTRLIPSSAEISTPDNPVFESLSKLISRALTSSAS